MEGNAGAALEVDLRIVAPTEVIAAFATEFETVGRKVAVSDVVDPSYLGLDFSTIADLCTIVSVALIDDALIPALARWVCSKAKRQRIMVESPHGRVIFDTDEDLTPEEIRTRLAEIIKLF